MRQIKALALIDCYRNNIRGFYRTKKEALVDKACKHCRIVKLVEPPKEGKE